MSDTPTPSSSDEDSNASPLPVEKQFVAELSDKLNNTIETKEEVLKLIPKDVRVPQSKFAVITF